MRLIGCSETTYLLSLHHSGSLKLLNNVCISKIREKLSYFVRLFCVTSETEHRGDRAVVQTAVTRPEFLDRISLITTLQFLVLAYLKRLNVSLPFSFFKNSRNLVTFEGLTVIAVSNTDRL
jgi:hypothetical protein